MSHDKECKHFGAHSTWRGESSLKTQCRQKWTRLQAEATNAVSDMCLLIEWSSCDVLEMQAWQPHNDGPVELDLGFLCAIFPALLHCDFMSLEGGSRIVHPCQAWRRAPAPHCRGVYLRA